MSILRQHRKRLELLLMLLVGLIWGILLSQLLQRTRFQFRDQREDMGSQCHNGCLTHLDAHTGSSSYPWPVASLINETEIKEEPPFNEARVLCMILTSPQTHHTRAIHIKHTWGSRCNKLIFMSTKLDNELETVALKVKEGNSNLWAKTRASLQYVYKHYFDHYDWFLKADDDTYVVMENLRSFLSEYTPKAPVYFGSKLRQYVQQGYTPSGASYVLSKAALQRLIIRGYRNASICSNRSYGIEDVELARCLENVGVVAGDSRDKHGLERFVPFTPLQSLNNTPKWYKPIRSIYVPSNVTQPQATTTSDCCSNSAISFHKSNPRDFYVLDYVIYKLRPFGLARPKEKFPEK